MSSSDKRSLTGKVVIVTGSSSGIGAATAVEFSRRGAYVIITGRNAEGLHKVATECKTASPKKQEPLSIVAEISNPKEMEKIINNTIKKYGRLDILVNNAAVSGKVAMTVDQTLESFDEVVAVNLRAPFYLIKLAIPELEKTKGCIVNVSSAGSKMAVPIGSIYGMLKAALDHFTKTLAVELGPKGIRVNAINPGFVRTNLTRDAGMPKEIVEQMLQKASSLSPLRTEGTPEGMATVIAFLASEEAAFITGASLLSDCGVTLSNPMTAIEQ